MPGNGQKAERHWGAAEVMREREGGGQPGCGLMEPVPKFHPLCLVQHSCHPDIRTHLLPSSDTPSDLVRAYFILVVVLLFHYLS
jgi:hypothetical protein